MNQSDYAWKDRGAGLKLHRAYQRIYKADLSKGHQVQAEEGDQRIDIDSGCSLYRGTIIRITR